MASVRFRRDMIRVLFGRQQFVEIGFISNAHLENPAYAEGVFVDNLGLGSQRGITCRDRTGDGRINIRGGLH